MEKLKAKVTKIEENTPDVRTIHFLVDGKALDFTAGQYITVYFDETGQKAGKAYSLSSAPDDKEMTITVKRIGEFSGKLHSLKRGNEVIISRPYGFFNVKDDKPIIAIAAGVGISPIWSIIRDELPGGRKVELLYSNKTASDVALKDEIDKLHGLRTKYFLTREKAPSFINRRIDIGKDIDTTEEASYYICGSQDFVTAMWQQLATAGIDEKAISTETFFENQ